MANVSFHRTKPNGFVSSGGGPNYSAFGADGEICFDLTHHMISVGVGREKPSVAMDCGTNRIAHTFYTKEFTLSVFEDTQEEDETILQIKDGDQVCGHVTINQSTSTISNTTYRTTPGIPGIVVGVYDAVAVLTLDEGLPGKHQIYRDLHCGFSPTISGSSINTRISMQLSEYTWDNLRDGRLTNLQFRAHICYIPMG